MTGRSKPTSHSVNSIFGDSLPDVTRDERDEGASADVAERDEWLRDNVPPHHH